MNMAKRPRHKIDFSPYGAAIKTARTGQKESRNKVGNEMYLSPRYLANIENNGQHPSLQIFFELMLRYNISVDQFLLDTPTGKDTKWRQLDALLDDIHFWKNCFFTSAPNSIPYPNSLIRPSPTRKLKLLQLYVAKRIRTSV